MDQAAIPDLSDLNIFNFMIIIPDEATAIRLCESYGLIPSRESVEAMQVRCECGRIMRIENNQEYKLKWRLKCPAKSRRDRRSGRIIDSGCGKTMSPLKNTWFERSKLNIRQSLLLVFCFLVELPVKLVVSQANIDHKTVVDYYVFCREVCQKFNSRRIIGGPGLEVEIDEHWLYVPKYHRGRKMKTQMWVVGGICRGTRELFLCVTGCKNLVRMHEIIRRHVEPLSFIHTDSNPSYNGVDEEFNNATGRGCNMAAHFTTNHRRWFTKNYEFVNPDTGENVVVGSWTNTIERQWLELKKKVKSCRSFVDDEGRTKNHALLYVEEFVYRHNRLHSLTVGDQMNQFTRDLATIYHFTGEWQTLVVDGGGIVDYYSLDIELEESLDDAVAYAVAEFEANN
ncbi:uncharacterized protein B4U80_06518 [Leptotrombidium deliense]|uniref:ISXO2-like transposase domain-containing protein n=1 Tax=Leptotrombidium deliense TaxID=299467 RepID=A0A443S3N3_9ACAR|nr:uncharacterized protein B4U80_06518 [Leptotrombidium deliense]